ncbi:glucose 1-dehydrogenase [Ramlibacter sp. AN1015]|uniref:SDR family NAD(P)-dependent oxidoreductase n=1 Tax=Ramlibacter sp. AN1015 TaxID=3133428 RepID=UPI0030C4A1E4
MSELPKTVIVTGGASGIGYAFCEHLATLGHRIVVADLRGGDEAAARLREQGAKAIGVQADVVSEEDVATMAAAAEREFGGIDVLVNNAGLFTTLALKPFEQITNQEWMRVMEVNTLGPFNCAKAVLPALRRSGRGRLVNIASTVPIKGPPNMSHYVASKGAVIAFTRSLARELAKDKITVNAIAPGFTLSDGVLQTDLQNRIGDNARTTGRCLQRDQVPADLVGALAYLVSDGAGFVTGQTLAVDGGGVFL